MPANWSCRVGNCLQPISGVAHCRLFYQAIKKALFISNSISNPVKIIHWFERLFQLRNAGGHVQPRQESWKYRSGWKVFLEDREQK